MALTTQKITIVDEKGKVTQFDLSKLNKITKPDLDLICIEFQGQKVILSNLGPRERIPRSS
jgi:hypothetical protein